MDLDAVKRRVADATPGPWWVPSEKTGEYPLQNPVIRAPHDKTGRIVIARTGSNNHRPQEWKNADFIAHARQDIPDLIAMVEGLESECSRLRQAITNN